MIIFIKVVPNSHKNSIEEFQDNIWKVRIQAPADKGKANEELIKFLSSLLGLPKNEIRILSGHSSRLKKIEIDDALLVGKNLKELGNGK